MNDSFRHLGIVEVLTDDGRVKSATAFCHPDHDYLALMGDFDDYIPDGTTMFDRHHRIQPINSFLEVLIEVEGPVWVPYTHMGRPGSEEYFEGMSLYLNGAIPSAREFPLTHGGPYEVNPNFAKFPHFMRACYDWSYVGDVLDSSIGDCEMEL